MPISKPFFTLEQQIDKLSDEKGLVINDRLYAESILKDVGYFSLVSGYKDLYRNPTTRRYKDGTTFEEIVALYQFDASLRELFLKYLLLIEQKMRSLLSYYFAEYYGAEQAHYLSPGSYDNIKKNAKGIKKLIGILNRIAITSLDYPYITHQRTKHGNVPLWVLAKVLTFGNISHMYQYLPQKLQSKISRNFIGVYPKDLQQYMRALTLFRNVCAHNERLFSNKVSENIPDTALHMKLGIAKKGAQYVCGKNDLFCVVIALRYLLNKKDFSQFIRRLGRIIEQFIGNTTHIADNELLSKMGFPANWKKVTAYRI